MSNIKFYHVGYTTVVTTSPRDLERENEVGTTEVIDYKVADVVNKLRELGPYKYLSQRAVTQPC
jgi:NADPH:quinone reductase-like Zn-dependent oxidoreductase